jgi:hypothetical protein
MPKALHIYPDPADQFAAAPDLSDELWTNAHLCRYFRIGTTKLANLKREPDFPRPALIAGMQRYPADQVRAYALSKQAHQQAHQQTPTAATTTTTEGTAL